MRTSSTRSRSSSSSRSPGVNASYTRRSQPPSSYISRPPLVRTSSSDKEHMTIAPIAPTILKTTGVGNHFVVAGFGHGRGSAAHASPPVNLVYVPPLGSGYARSNSGSANGGSSGEEVYRYRESRFSVGDASGSGSRSPSDRVVASPDLLPVPEAEALPIPGPERYGHPPYLAPSARVLSPPMVESPIGAHEEDGFDYFSGVSPQVNTADLLSVGLESDLGVDMMHPPDTVLQGRLGRSRSGSMPEVVVNDVNGAIEERREVEEGSPSRSRSRSRSRSMSRSRSRSRSHSRTPSPAEMMSFESPGIPGVSSSLPMPVSRSNSTHTVPASGSHDTALLSPPEYVHSRGRASSISTAVPSPVITSTPAPDLRSRSFSSDRDSRGRSTTRTSSFSDRERSSSRNGAGSPIGSVSPTASGIGLAAQGRGRMRKSSVEGSMRGRAGRRGCAGDSSASPSSPVVGVESRSLDTIADAIVAAAIEPSLSRSSMESQSPSPTHASGSRAPVAKPALPLPNIPAPIIEEDEHARSVSSNTSSSTSTLRYTSPVDMIKPAVPAPPTSATAPVMAERPQSTIKTSSMGQSAARPVSPTSPTEDGGGLVGRAAEMMSTARGLFGAFWHSGGPSGASVA
ncbi:hypothetical protein BV25DRAFT_1831072 [Artomyces pyxidatus]|uniref:Uncharacterized protein n=1 Tax=Artomyces pyxidatus TaxID=48021 RepID=A0ACB8SLK7_9AGAM|nr:hypothetical protein BV25DRAFT_1831072 [Artomyces pyxidatus]